jgi:hypothetical protein
MPVGLGCAVHGLAGLVAFSLETGWVIQACNRARLEWSSMTRLAHGMMHASQRYTVHRHIQKLRQRQQAHTCRDAELNST